MLFDYLAVERRHTEFFSLIIFFRLKYTWEPLVLGPALAMERRPAFVCLSLKFSSGNLAVGSKLAEYQYTGE